MTPRLDHKEAKHGGAGAPAVSARVGIGRAIGGAIVFSLPMMMTMELWQIGLYISPFRLMLLTLVSLPLFLGISIIVGFKDDIDFKNNVLDVLVAYALAFFTVAITLLAFGVITAQEAWLDSVQIVALEAVPATLGALLARSEIGDDREHDFNYRKDHYGLELTVLATGALFLAFNIAPTEEVILVAYAVTPWHALAIFVLTMGLMHAFTIATAKQTHRRRPLPSHSHLFTRYTCAAYIAALAVSFFMLWVFGRIDHTGLGEIFTSVIVLGFPAGIGAAAARLLL